MSSIISLAVISLSWVSLRHGDGWRNCFPLGWLGANSKKSNTLRWFNYLLLWRSHILDPSLLVSLNTRPISPGFCLYPCCDVEAQILLLVSFAVQVPRMSHLITLSFQLTTVLSQDLVEAAMPLITIGLRWDCWPHTSDETCPLQSPPCYTTCLQRQVLHLLWEFPFDQSTQDISSYWFS